MEPKFVLAIILALIFLYFGLGPGSRLLKKKSHHHIDPPASTDDPNWIPIEMKDYKSSILFKLRYSDVTTEELKAYIEEDFSIKDLDLTQFDEWYLLSLKDIGFEKFHTMILIINASNEGDVWGYGKHINTPAKDYVTIYDKDSGSHHLIGSFRNTTNFGIYLPKSNVHEHGNMSKSSIKEVNFKDVISKLPMEKIEA